MKNLNKKALGVCLLAIAASMAGCNSENPDATTATNAAPEQGSSQVVEPAAATQKPAFAILTQTTSTIDILKNATSAPADFSFKNHCIGGAQAIGLSDINFGGKLYCSDAASRSIKVLDLDLGTELFSWNWPNDITGSAVWLIGRWQVNGPVGLAAYEPTTGIFHFYNQAEKLFTLSHSIEYGGIDAQIKPLVGDWNGDGSDTIGVYKASNQQMDLRNALDAGIADISFRFVEGSIDVSSQPVVVNTTAGSTAGMYSIEQGSVTLGSVDLAKQPQAVFLFGTPGVAKNALPIR